MKKLLPVYMAFCLLVSALPAAAQGPQPLPNPTPTPTPSNVQTIVQVFQQIVQFPFDNIQQALTNAFTGMLQKSLIPLQTAVDFALTQTVFGSMPILNGAGPATAFQTTWAKMRDLSLVLWPVLLAVLALVAMTKSAVVLGYDVEQWWQLLIEYGLVVCAAATSLYWMDALNTLSITLTREIMALGIGVTLTPTLLSNALLGSALVILTAQFTGGLTLLLAFLVGMVGFIVLVLLILQFTARYALMFVLVSIAPFAILLELLPPAKWLSRLWLKGLVMTLLLAPTNALLYKFTSVMLGQLGSSNLGDLGGALGNFFAALGVMSLLITLNFAVLKGVYAGIHEVTSMALNTTKSLMTMGVALAGAVAGGIAAGGMALGGGAAAGGSPIAGGGAGATAAAARNPHSPSPTAALRSPRGMEAAGAVLASAHHPLLRTVGSALRTVGGAGAHQGQPQTQPARDGQRGTNNSSREPQSHERYSTEGQMRELSQMAGELGPMNSVTRAGIASGLFNLAKDMDSAPGMAPGSSMPLMRQTWPAVATGIQAARSNGGLSLAQIAAQKGFEGPGAVPNFVRNEVAMAMANQGEPVTTGMLQTEQAWSQRPLYADYQIGAYVGRQLHSDSPVHAAAFAELYHFLRTSQHAHAQTLSYQFVKMAREMGAQANPEALRGFVNETALMLDQAGVGPLPHDLTAWRRLERSLIRQR